MANDYFCSTRVIEYSIAGKRLANDKEKAHQIKLLNGSTMDISFYARFMTQVHDENDQDGDVHRDGISFRSDQDP